MNPFNWVRSFVRQACHLGYEDFCRDLAEGESAAVVRVELPALTAPLADQPEAAAKRKAGSRANA